MIATIGIGFLPSDIAYDSDDHRMYIANSGSNTVSVIATAHFPSNTNITSAVHGNGNSVQNKGPLLQPQ